MEWQNLSDLDVDLPFQTIEHIDELHLEESKSKQVSMFDPMTGRQIKGWTNKLILLISKKIVFRLC